MVGRYHRWLGSLSTSLLKDDMHFIVNALCAIAGTGLRLARNL